MMDDAELAQKLGEAMRMYSTDILNGAVAQFRKLKDNVSIDVTMVLTDDGHLHFKVFEPFERQIPQSQADIDANSVPLTEEQKARFTPILEAPGKIIEEPYKNVPDSEFSSDEFTSPTIEEKPKRKRKTTI